MSTMREIAWPEEFVELQRIEEYLICGICYNYIDTAVMTPCSHNYCSLCIRKYLHYKAQCPACFQPTFEKDLYINRTLDTVIRYFSKIRDKLISNISIKPNVSIVPKVEVPCSPPVRPARSPRASEEKQSRIEFPSTPIPPASAAAQSPSTTQRSLVLKNEASSSSINLTPKKATGIAKLFGTPKSKKLMNATLPVSTNSVPCPVCSVSIQDTHINRHLDDCLKRENVAKEPVKIVPKRQPLPKLVLHVMKDAQLRKKMKEFGLSIQGDRKAMEARFQRYSTIYNAECDKPDPRAIPELIKQCEQEENLERRIDRYMTTGPPAVRLQIDRNAKEENIEEAQRKYREANQSSFDKLIAEVRKRNAMKVKEPGDTPSVHSSVSQQDESSSPTKSFKNQSSLDSDSDNTLCPLQYYSRDDAMKLVSAQYSESSGSSTSTLKDVDTETKTDNCDMYENKLNEESVNDCYNVTTDPESSDTDEVPESPAEKTDSNHKRVRLSELFVSQTLSPSSSFVTDIDEVTTDQAQREAFARDTRDSIIKDFTFNDSSDSSENEFIEKPIKTLPEQASNLDLCKENLTKNSMSRPVRKRNCSSRYRSDEPLQPISDHRDMNGAQDAETKISPISDGTLKRRRGRSVVQNLGHSPDESQNPPKRPVRRRQVNSNRNLC